MEYGIVTTPRFLALPALHLPPVIFLPQNFSLSLSSCFFFVNLPICHLLFVASRVFPLSVNLLVIAIVGWNVFPDLCYMCYGCYVI